MDRRGFLVRSGLVLGGGVLAAATARARGLAAAEPAVDVSSWEAVRSQFSLTPDRIHMSGFLLASHPRPVREAIERHRRGLDLDPPGYLHAHETALEADVVTAVGDYLAVQPDEIALTDSTTMGLGLLYGGMKLGLGQEIVTTVHDHYSTETSLRLRAERTGAQVRQVALYDQGSETSVEQCVQRLDAAITPRTRIVAVTWVHSSTGVKLPIRALADLVERRNRDRAEPDRVLLCVDGVHGLGIDAITLADLGCDFFVAGTHKWMFGPRGTGIVWGAPHAWPTATPIIPTFSGDAYLAWMNIKPEAQIAMATQMTPGGFHSFEHRWALGEAFRFHQQIGKPRVAERIHALNRQLKEGLAQMPGIRLHTPASDALSAGIVCFEVDGLEPWDVARRLGEKRITASVTPYAKLFARLAPSLLNSPQDVDRTLEAVREIR